MRTIRPVARPGARRQPVRTFQTDCHLPRPALRPTSTTPAEQRLFLPAPPDAADRPGGDVIQAYRSLAWDCLWRGEFTEVLRVMRAATTAVRH